MENKSNDSDQANLSVKIYGCRGTNPVSEQTHTKYGGNTTCLRIKSKCLPTDTALIIDTGTGFIRAGEDLISEGIFKLFILYTHWHYDHCIGIITSPYTFELRTSFSKIVGPKSRKMNINSIFTQLIRPPFFPISFYDIRKKIITSNSIGDIGEDVIIIHKDHGIHLIKNYTLRGVEKIKSKIIFPSGEAVKPEECLIIKMHRAKHTDETISYRLEERPTNKVLTFLTDHENSDHFEDGLLSHVINSDVLIQDCQYSRINYEKMKGRGHSTPDYCVDLMITAKAKKLFLTHHDPGSKDEDIESILQEAKDYARRKNFIDTEENIFTCYDYQTIET